MNIKLSSCALLLIPILLSCSGENEYTSLADMTMSIEGHTLSKTVILSRHNIRSPLVGPSSILSTITPHEWFEWTSNASELSLKGGILETEMGQYFRKWLESERLFPENYRPLEGEVRFYANVKQRTIATTNYFSSALLPSFDADIEVKVPFDTMDPVFNPCLNFVSDSYVSTAKAEISSLFDKRIEGLSDNYELLCNVIDFKDSEAYRSGAVSGFNTDDTVLSFQEGKEPAMSGSLKTGCSVSDALTLQYYEEKDATKAAFGHALSFDQWKAISEIKDLYGDVLFTAPSVCVNVAHPLLEEIASELNSEERKFAFLCGHDSNVGSVLASLEVEDYELPKSIESKTPIGCKLTFNTYLDAAKKEYCLVSLVYQSVEQLRANAPLDLKHPPMIVPLKFKGIASDANGLCLKEDLLKRLEESIARYDDMVSTYSK